MRQSHSLFRKEVEGALDKFNCFYLFLYPHGQQQPGMPDVLVFKDGKAVGIEIKMRTELSKIQKQTFKGMQEKGGVKTYILKKFESNKLIHLEDSNKKLIAESENLMELLALIFL